MYTKAWSIDRKGEWGGGTKKIFHEAPPPAVTYPRRPQGNSVSSTEGLEVYVPRRSGPELRWIP